MTRCSQALQEGKLVAFPTETVYGLGANALDASASKKIFALKGRPPTDPLIVHVSDLSLALPLWDLPSSNVFPRLPSSCVNVINALAKTFWPGPLTIVHPAAAHVPNVVCGIPSPNRASSQSTQMSRSQIRTVGVRVPSNMAALRLLQQSKLPIAAPSANRFGHVSPTTAAHVASDFEDYEKDLSLFSGHESLLIINGGAQANPSVGIESTVVRVHPEDTPDTTNLTHNCKYIEILRRGKVTFSNLRRCLDDHSLADIAIAVREAHYESSRTMTLDAPGQLLTHYAPRIPAYLLSLNELNKVRCEQQKGLEKLGFQIRVVPRSEERFFFGIVY